MPDDKFAKANVTKDTIKIINKIAAEEDKYIYQIIGEAIRKVHPEYFKNNVKIKEEIKVLNH
jgi:chaperonin GroEL (HSP60 family)